MIEFPQLVANMSGIDKILEIIQQTYGREFEPTEWEDGSLGTVQYFHVDPTDAQMLEAAQAEVSAWLDADGIGSYQLFNSLLHDLYRREIIPAGHYLVFD